MKEKNHPDLPSEEKGYKTKPSFQSEEKPIPDDDEWFDGQDGKLKGYFPIHKGILTPSEEVLGGKVIPKEIEKSFTKRSMYEWFKNTKSDYEKDDFYKIYIHFPRDRLIKRIHTRTIDMINGGAIIEVKKLE